MGRSEELFERARACIPGGVNSPVRAFGSVGMTPRFIERAELARLWDADGRSYTDYVLSWGPMILGHARQEVLERVKEAAGRGLSFGAATEAEVLMAELICSMVPSVEMVRMVNSGTEAVMSAIRTARGFTGRDKIVKFAGNYHGHSDAMLIEAGSGLMTASLPSSAGVPRGCTEDTLSASYNDLEGVRALFEANKDRVAAVIVEPVAANMGVVLPSDGFLKGLRDLCDENGSLLIFDEVITGFRLGPDGAQGYFGVKPDLTTFGKIIGAGMPVGAYGGRRDIMEMVSPAGPVYQAGTLSGNPVAMAAGMAQLEILKNTPGIYEQLNSRADKFFSEIEAIFKEAGEAAVVNHVGSLGSVFFTSDPVNDYDSAKKCDTDRFRDYFAFMISEGVYLAPSQFEAMFLSTVHTDEQLGETLEAVRKYVKHVKTRG